VSDKLRISVGIAYGERPHALVGLAVEHGERRRQRLVRLSVDEAQMTFRPPAEMLFDAVGERTRLRNLAAGFQKEGGKLQCRQRLGRALRAL